MFIELTEAGGTLIGSRTIIFNTDDISNFYEVTLSGGICRSRIVLKSQPKNVIEVKESVKQIRAILTKGEEKDGQSDSWRRRQS